MATIRFLRMNRYGKPVGHEDSSFPYGVQEALVIRGVAEWVKPSVMSAMSEPILSEDKSDTLRRNRKREV